MELPPIITLLLTLLTKSPAPPSRVSGLDGAWCISFKIVGQHPLNAGQSDMALNKLYLEPPVQLSELDTPSPRKPVISKDLNPKTKPTILKPCSLNQKSINPTPQSVESVVT